MTIPQKVGLVNELFNQLDKEINLFQKSTNLGCVKGCGKCCNKPDIYASPLEFLPWAFHVFLNNQAIDKLDELKNTSSTICNVFEPLTIVDKVNGKCSDYTHRGLICRLFGFAANRDKYGKLKLATCTVIKEDQKEDFELANQAITEKLEVPIFTDYYMKLSQIDYRLATESVLINKAMILALEEVLQYYAYRPYPTKLKNVA